MKKQCLAYVEAKQARCLKLTSTKYCWSHKPKGDIFLSTVIGIIIGFAVPNGYDLRSERKQQEHLRATIATVSHRAQKIVIEGELVLNGFLVSSGDSSVLSRLNQAYAGNQSKEVSDILREAFRKSSMNKYSTTVTYMGGEKPTHLELFIGKMRLVYTEAEAILNAYGGVTHPLIQAIESMRTKSKFFLEISPLYEQLGGLSSMLDSSSSVKEQWADFFADYYSAHFKLKRLYQQELAR